MKKLIILVSLITYFSVELIQANNYVWLHGLNDNSGCWTIYDQTFTPGIGTRVWYSSNNSIPGIASGIWGNSTFNYDTNNYENLSSKSNVILIGHSLGGLVAREIEAKHTGNIKGIITIGTPHQGAPIENGLANGGVKQLAGKVYDKLMASISSSLGCLTGGIFSFQVGNDTWLGAQALADLYKVPAIDLLMGSLPIPNGSQPSEKDMQVGSAYLNNSPKVNVPILCFAAEEGRWALARMAYCGENKAKLQTDPTINANGTYDQNGYDIQQIAVDGCYIFSGIHAAITINCAAAGFCDPYLWYIGGLNAIASYNWYSMADYLNNGLDYDHGVLVGNCGYEQRSYCYTTMVCQGQNPPPTLEEGPQHVTAPVCVYVPATICVTSTVTVPVGNDGLVSTYTQTLNTNQGVNVIIPSSTIKSVNHMEEFNHPNTKEAFRSTIVDGANGPYFQK